MVYSNVCLLLYLKNYNERKYWLEKIQRRKIINGVEKIIIADKVS